MPKKWKDRWRVKDPTKKSGYRQHQESYDSKAERDTARARRLLREKAPTMGSSMPFRALADLWLEDHAKLNKAASQYLQDKRTIDGYFIPTFGDVPLKDLRSTHLKDLKLKLQKGSTLSGKPVKPKTVNNIIALAKAMTRMATDGDEPLLASDPFRSVSLVEIDEQPFDYWTAEERDRFLQFCRNVDPVFAELVLVACHTGLRRSELAGLQRRHLNFERRMITVAETHCFMTKRRQHRTKNRQMGWVAMNDAVFEALKDRQLMAMDAPVFDPGLLEYGSEKVQRYAKAFQVKPIRFHDLRHTFASTLAMAGVPIYEIQALMRHQSIKMTQRYAHLSPGHLATAAAAICKPSAHKEECARSVRDETGQLANVVNLQG